MPREGHAVVGGELGAAEDGRLGVLLAFLPDLRHLIFGYLARAADSKVRRVRGLVRPVEEIAVQDRHMAVRVRYDIKAPHVGVPGLSEQGRLRDEPDAI